MSEPEINSQKRSGWDLTVDAWAVIFALILTILVKLGWIGSVFW